MILIDDPEEGPLSLPPLPGGGARAWWWGGCGGCGGDHGAAVADVDYVLIESEKLHYVLV